MSKSLWPLKCRHIDAGVFEPYVTLTMKNAPEKPDENYDIWAEVALCPFCAGLVTSMLRYDVRVFESRYD